MQLSSQIKKYRTELSLSQEELAEKVFVTRQTISNWENDKSYPDIHSLLLLSSLFDVSLDNLIKGDLDVMKEKISSQELARYNRNANIFAVLFIGSIVLFVPLAKLLKLAGVILWGILYAITLVFALKVHKVQKENDVSTFKEIVAFSEGKKLDEIQNQREIGKRPYQNVLKLLFGALLAVAVFAITGFIFSKI